MAKKKTKQGGLKYYGGDVYRATQGGLIASGNSRVATNRARQVTDSAVASFGRSIGPYGAGSTEHANYSQYGPVDPYGYGYEEEPYYDDGYYLDDPYAYYDEPYANEPYGTSYEYFDEPFGLFDQLSDYDDDYEGIGWNNLVSAANAANATADPVNESSGFWGSLGAGASNLVGGVGNALGGLVGGVGNILGSVGNLVNAAGSNANAYTSKLSAADTATLRDALDKVSKKTKAKTEEAKGTFDKILPLAALAGAGFLAFKAMKK